MYILILIVFSILFVAMYTKQMYGILAFNSIWIIIYILFPKTGANTFDDLFKLTKIILLLMMFSVNFGYIFSKFNIGKQTISEKENNFNWQFNGKLYNKIQILTTLVLLFYFAKVVSTFGFNLSAIRAASSGASENATFVSLFDTIIFYGVVAPLVNVSIMVLVYCIRTKNFDKTTVYLTITNALMFMTIEAGRMLLIRLLIYLTVMIIYTRKRNKISQKKSKLTYKYVFVIILIYLALTMMTGLRNSENSVSFIDQMIDYIHGSILHMNYQLMLNSQGIKYSFGSIVYGGFLYYPIKFVNIIFDLNLVNSMSRMSYLQEYIQIDLKHIRYYNALVPQAYYFFVESGFFGVFAHSTIQGYVLGKSELQRNENYSFFHFSILCIAFYSIVFSPLGGIFWNMLMPSTIVYILILKNFIFNKKN